METREGSAPKRGRVRPRKTGHFHDKLSPTHFAKVILAPRSDLLPIPKDFPPYLDTLPKRVTLKTNIGCTLNVKIEETNGRVTSLGRSSRDQIGYFLTFKVMKGDIYNVTVFDCSMTEVVRKCP
jgi:hypothetical protein